MIFTDIKQQWNTTARHGKGKGGTGTAETDNTNLLLIWVPQKTTARQVDGLKVGGDRSREFGLHPLTASVGGAETRLFEVIDKYY